MMLLALVACSTDDANNAPPAGPARRTVVVYMAGENNLSNYVEDDLWEMKTGRAKAAANENLVVFVDRQPNKTKPLSEQEKPFIALVTTDKRLDTLYRYQDDFYSSDPTQMTAVLKKAIELCPATEDYGLVLWGHGSSWIIEKDSIVTPSHRAYGYDDGSDDNQGRWMNIPTLRTVLASVPVKWKFIFFDCCNMISAEVAYELRNAADYLIGSPAEIPGIGAPYYNIVNDLFCHDDAAMYTQLCDHYFDQPGQYQGEHTPLAVVKTAAMPLLAEATRQVLPQVAEYLKSTETPMKDAIYYFADPKHQNEKVMYDIQDIVITALQGDPAKSRSWLDAFRQAVVYSKPSPFWNINYSADYYVKFSDFTQMKDGVRVFKHGNDHCGVMSMFFPLEQYDHASRLYNEDIKKLGWYYTVGW